MTAAFMDVQKNPENVSKYESNPKVKKVMEKLSATLGMGGMGGAPSGMGGAGQGSSAHPPPAASTSSSAHPPPAASTSSSAKPSPSGAAADMDLD